MSKPILYKVVDAVPGLTLGETYSCTKSGRLHAFVNVKTGVKTTMYKHEIEHAIAHGKLVETDDVQSEKMHCAVVDQLCKHTPNRFIY